MADLRRGRGRWLVSLLATSVSAYALDAVATACGIAVLASGSLDGLEGPALVLVLVASYAGWGLGLSRSLRANLSLLDRTGVSTNVVSKAAYDLTRRRTGSRQALRVAAAAGYVATELVKEIPYYVGAFGAAAVGDGLSSSDAVVLLIGANLGAGLYEYVLAGVTRLALRRRAYATFESEWDPEAYLDDYYQDVEPDEVETIAYLVDGIRDAARAEPVLFYGTGPTLHHVFLATPVASEIHLADYLPGNLEEVRRWLAGDPAAHDWRPFVRYTLRCEGDPNPDDAAVTRREELTRATVTRLLTADGRSPGPSPHGYATVVSAYCADSATSDRRSWAAFLTNVMDNTAPGGLFLTAALHRSDGYLVGGRLFPSARVRRRDLRRVLEGAWGRGCAEVVVRSLPGPSGHGYSGVLLATARRPETRIDGALPR
ncbi:putative Amine N-methyltransferase [Nostocoides japonicum T1-X7]|uniref:Putative Amine N-methyltransferase n=1 Tax=Nostocoides japonicum T1-X7 TaxID=1194083 RepID=A0A077LTL2_9MICO|nr:guanitoxin biosynthesis pre-guanitoxin forming N-methyltransferase GntF [Tetrasphaera japonica]CCH76928.1 putative Amine N-methyltransferase [Tetrasphaera japonica T1-X7]